MAGYNLTRFTEDLLERTDKLPPSFTVHLHPEHWTLNNGSKFLYNNQIASLLDDIRAHRIPVEFLDLFDTMKVPFYEGCMIVELLDYRPRNRKDPLLTQAERTRTVLHPNGETLWADLCLINQKNGLKLTDQDALHLEAQILLATSPPLCLHPDTHLSRIANHVLRVSTPTEPLSLKRKATALDPEEDEVEKGRKLKMMQYMSSRNRTMPTYRVLDALKRHKAMEAGKPLVPPPSQNNMSLAPNPSSNATHPVTVSQNSPAPSNPPSLVPAHFVSPARHSPVQPPPPQTTTFIASSPAAESDDSKKSSNKPRPATPQSTFPQRTQTPHSAASSTHSPSPSSHSPMPPPAAVPPRILPTRTATPAARQYTQSPRPVSTQPLPSMPLQPPQSVQAAHSHQNALPMHTPLPLPSTAPTMPNFQPNIPNAHFLHAPPLHRNIPNKSQTPAANPPMSAHPALPMYGQQAQPQNEQDRQTLLLQQRLLHQAQALSHAAQVAQANGRPTPVNAAQLTQNALAAALQQQRANMAVGANQQRPTTHSPMPPGTPQMAHMGAAPHGQQYALASQFAQRLVPRPGQQQHHLPTAAGQQTPTGQHIQQQPSALPNQGMMDNSAAQAAQAAQAQHNMSLQGQHQFIYPYHRPPQNQPQQPQPNMNPAYWQAMTRHLQQNGMTTQQIAQAQHAQMQQMNAQAAQRMAALRGVASHQQNPNMQGGPNMQSR